MHGPRLKRERLKVVPLGSLPHECRVQPAVVRLHGDVMVGKGRVARLHIEFIARAPALQFSFLSSLVVAQNRASFSDVFGAAVGKDARNGGVVHVATLVKRDESHENFGVAVAPHGLWRSLHAHSLHLARISPLDKYVYDNV